LGEPLGRWIGTIYFFPLEFEKNANFFLMKLIGKAFIFHSVGQAIDNLSCNLKRQAQVTSLTTIMRIMYCCAFKYQSLLDVVATFFIKDHSTLVSIICLKKLFIFCFKIVAKNIMVKFTFSMCN
jgi:hypothetical protein